MVATQAAGGAGGVALALPRAAPPPAAAAPLVAARSTVDASGAAWRGQEQHGEFLDDAVFELALDELLEEATDWGDVTAPPARPTASWGVSGAFSEADDAADRASGESALRAAAGAHDEAPLHVLRCLDSKHAQPCALCTPAPAEDEEGDYELVGDPGKKNGEKRLRALLCRTREWNSVEERARLAALCSSRAASAAPGGPMATSMTRLAAALRAKRSAALAKAHLLLCVRAWGYASDVWFRHGRATRAREMAAVADAEAMARARTRATPEQEREPAPHEDDDDGDEGSQDRGEVPTADAEPEPPSEPPSAAELRLMGGGFPWDVGFNVRELSVADATAEIERQLRPLALAATALIAGPDACAAARTLGASHISVHDLAEVRKAVAHTASFHRWYLGVRATVQNELAAAVAADGGAPTPAWRRLAGRDTPVEASLRGFAARLRSAAMRNCPHAFFAAPHIVDAMRGGELAHAPVCDGGERAALPPCSSDGSHEDSCLSGVPREATEHDAALAAGASASDKRLAATRRWLNEMFRGLCASVELATRLQLLVTDAKLAAHTTFWEVSLLVTDTMLLFTSASSEAFARRAAWMAEVLVASAPPLLDGASFEAPAAPAAKPRLLFEFMSSCGDSCGSSPAAASVSDA